MFKLIFLASVALTGSLIHAQNSDNRYESQGSPSQITTYKGDKYTKTAQSCAQVVAPQYPGYGAGVRNICDEYIAVHFCNQDINNGQCQKLTGTGDDYWQRRTGGHSLPPKTTVVDYLIPGVKWKLRSCFNPTGHYFFHTVAHPTDPNLFACKIWGERDYPNRDAILKEEIEGFYKNKQYIR